MEMWKRRVSSENEWRFNVAVPFRIRGSLNVEALRRSVEDIIGRHDILRTTFAQTDGQPVASIHPPHRFDLACEDLRMASDPEKAAADILESECHWDFDLGSGPLLRLRLLQIGEQDFRLIRNGHHLISDAGSWKLFFDELRMHYDAHVENMSLPIDNNAKFQYIDFASWEQTRSRREPARYAEALDYWQSILSHPPARQVLPFGPADVDPVEVPQVGVLRWGLAQRDTKLLDRVARDLKATYFMSRLAPYAALLALECSAPEIMIGTPLSMRTRPELQHVFGPMTNFGLIRVGDPSDCSFRDWLGQVRSVVLDMSAHADIPFPLVIPELLKQGLRPPRVSASFASALPMKVMQFDEMELEPLQRECQDFQVFRVGVNRAYEEDRNWAEFDPMAHNSIAVGRFVKRLQALMAAVAADPDRKLRELYARLPG
jgi:hypothetical protein